MFITAVVAEIRHACAIVLSRVVDHATEVYLTLRSMKLAFLAGFHAFPGGTMAEVDARVAVSNTSERLPSHVISCAARELFEECGVVKGPLAKAENRDLIRQQVLDNDSVWADLVASGAVTLDAADYRAFGRWLTPPFSPTRFNAHYLQLDARHEDPVIWPGELDEGEWMRPQAAIDAHQAGTIFLSYPVIETLAVMIRHSDIAEAAIELEARGLEAYPHAGGEMVTGIHVVPVKSPTLPPATHTNVYVIGNDELIVIDPAAVELEEQERLIGYLEFLKAPVKEVWLTHHHRDHYGAAELLRERYNVPIAAHALTAETIGIRIDRLISNGETTTLTLAGGYQAEWVALHTPGHARGHLCFFEKRLRSLIAGDLVSTLGTVVIAPPDGNMRDYVASLKQMRTLEPRLLFPAHGAPVAAIARLDTYLAHRKARENAILSAIEDQKRTSREIMTIVYAEIAQSSWPLAELNVRAHLDKLLEEDRVRQNGEAFELVR
ncbi:MAG: MBL fold metallo-hydrolase [Clostridia bacterium]|nr:MBL fold metallo-hydrolase [Deltaproteobacteria bacterium]